MNDEVVWPESGCAGVPVRSIVFPSESPYPDSPCFEAMSYLQKPGGSELKGTFSSKDLIAFQLQMRKLRQGHRASQWEHGPSVHPFWCVHGGH